MAISKDTSGVYVLKSEEKEKGISKDTSNAKNKGNTLGYVAGNIGLGALGMFEGTYDYTVGLANSLAGDKAYSKYIMQHDITGGLTQKLNDYMNPGKVMQYAGEVGQGIGQSSIFLLNNIGAGPIGTILFAAGAAGRATAEAQNTTGKLGVKEYAYGAVDSAKEMALEWLSGQTFTGLNKTKYSLSKGISNLLGKTSKEAANVATRRGVIKTMISEGASEFFEEFLGSYIETHNKHVMLNDPNAEYSLSEALYSGLVGFGSGSIMSGVSGTVRAAASHARGSKIVSEGKTGQVLKNAQIVKDFYKDQKWSDWADSESITRVYHDLVASYEAYSKLSADQVTSDKAMVYLGEMEINGAQLECLAEVGGEGEIVKQHAQKYADFASKFFNETITEEDVKNNKNGIANNIALMRWVGYFDNEETVLDAKNQWIRETIEKNSKKGAEAAQNVAGTEMGNNAATAPEGSTEGPSYVKTGVTPGGIEYSENSLYNLSTRVYDLGEGRSVVAFQKPGDNGKIGWSLDIGEGTSMVDGNGDSVGYSEVLDDDKIDSIVDDIKKNYDTIMDDAETRKEQKEAETEKKSGEKKTEKKTKKKLKIGNDTVQLATEEDLKKAKIIGDQYKEVTDKLTISQKAQALLLNKMFEGTKYKVLLYSGAGNKGITGAYHGNTIYVDVNSKMLRVTAHELVHSFVKQSPEQYEALKSFVIKSLYEGDEAKLTEAAQEIIDSYKKTGQKLSKEAATEEIVAKSCEEVFGSSKIIKQMLKTDSKLFDAVFTFLDGWQHMIDAAISNYGESNQYLKRMNENAETIKEVRRLFADALKTTYKNQLGDNGSKQEKKISKAMEEDTELGAGEVQRTDSGEMILAESADGTEVFLSYETYNEYGRKRLAQLLKDQGYSKEEVEAAMKPIEAASKYIGNLAKEFSAEGYDALQEHFYASVERDYRGRQILHALVKNGDYPVNIDLSTICKKRVAYTKLLLRLMDSGIFGKVSYDGEAIARVNEILRKYGFETACMGCFVESRRLQIQAWAEGFAAKWNEAAEKLNPGCKYFDWSTRRDNVLMTEEEVLKLETELSEHEKNDKGNVNLGQGSVETRIKKLMKKVPGLQQKIDASSLLDPAGLKAMRGYAGGTNIYSLLLQNYGAATPKIVQEYNAYNSEIADLTFKFAQETTGESVTGADAYRQAAKQLLKDSEPKKYTGKNEDRLAEYKAAKAKWDARVEEEAVRNYLFAVGGVRIQSFSDFMIENVFDYYQILTDLAVRGLPMHGYTKEITAMRLFGMSGIKWNGSLIATVSKGMYADADTDKRFAGLIPEAEYEKLKVDGKIPKGLEALKVTGRDGKTYYIGFDDVARNQATKGKTFIQSIGLKDVMALILDKRYSKNCGNITIGVSDEQILAMIRSPYFRMVIPYHKSGMLPEYAALVGVDMYNDYEDYQETKVEKLYDKNGKLIAQKSQKKYVDAKGKEVTKAVKKLIKKVPTHFDFNEAANRLGDAKAAADEYLAWCADRNNHVILDDNGDIEYIAECSAKFSNSPYGYDFTKEENYYKILEDFNEYDLLDELSDKKTAALQDSAKMILPGQDGTKLSEKELREYAQRLRDTGIFTEDDIKKYVERANWTDEDIIRHELEGRAQYTRQTDGKFELAYKETYGMLMERERTGNAITFKKYKEKNETAKEARKKGIPNYGVNPPKGTYRITEEDAFKHSFEEIDDEYDQAVKENNESRMAELVKAAAAKAGFKSPKLFHGTNAFGFTVTDVKKSDDRISFFATDSLATAKSYSNIDESKAISGKTSISQIGNIKEAMRYWGDSIAYKVGDKLSEMYGVRNMFDGDYISDQLASIAESSDSFEDADQEIYEWLQENVLELFYDSYLNDPYGDDEKLEFDEWSESDEGQKIYEALGDIETAFSKLADPMQFKDEYGNYSLYANTDGFLELDAEGNLWNHLNLKDIPTVSTTRGLARWANNNGYKGVILRNVLDNGAFRDGSEDPSTIYIFFDPSSQVKSADNVTYDDAGNVIPLSERFNQNKNDLRYSVEELFDPDTDRKSATMYSGGGLVELGLIFNHIKHMFGVEWEPKIAAVYADNYDHKIYAGKDNGDVVKFDSKQMKGIWALHGSPVCHDFSNAKQRAKITAEELQQDLDSAKAFARHIEYGDKEDLRLVTVENAPSYKNSEALKAITDTLDRLGWTWDVDIYNSSDYGSATDRRRCILRAVKEGDLPPKPVKVGSTKTWDGVTRDLWSKYQEMPFAPNQLDAISNTPGLDITENKKAILCLETTNGHQMVYVEEGHRAPTLTTKISEARLVLPGGKVVKPDVQFFGRIMGMPDSYKYPTKATKNQTVGYTIVGNGVPVELTKAVIGELYKSEYENETGDTLYSYEDSGYAPTFYSQMSNVISEIKQDKIGAASVVNYLKGKGVKDEEIKWSGIETFLEGKKSVTKKDLQEFAAGSMLQIDEVEMSEMSAYELDDKLYEYTGNMQATDYIDDTDETLDTEWIIGDLKDLLSEGDITQEQYDELVELTHKAATRWHGYRTDSGDYYKELLFKLPNSDYSNYAMRNHWGERGILAHARIQDMKTDDGGLMLFIEEIQSDWHNAGKKWGYKNKEDAFELREDGDRFVLYKNGEKTFEWDYKKSYAIKDENYNPTGEYDTKKALDFLKSQSVSSTDPVPNAPFKDTYTDYVIKRLLRSAAAQGYDSIGWTTANMQSERWSDDYAEGYRIEYDQDIPKFLNKYGKKWGGKVDKAEIGSGDTVWRFVIPEAMKKSVLYEGQPLYSYEDSASITEDRLEYLIDDSGAGSRKDYAQKWITSIDPGEFLKMTLLKNNQDRSVFDNMPGEYGSTVKDRDFISDLKRSMRQTPYLEIDVDTGDVIGHEGRHRMRALEKAGIKKADIVLMFYKNGNLVKDYNKVKNELQSIESLTINNQRGTGQQTIVENVIPINQANKEKILENYAQKDAGIRYSQEDAISKQLNSGDEENLIYIKNDTKTGRSFIDLILDGKKKGETRNHKRLTRKWVGISDGEKVYGRVRLGDPIEITNKSPEYKDAYIKGTEYDIKDGESKYYYPILEREDFRDNPRDIQKHGNYGKYKYSFEGNKGNGYDGYSMSNNARSAYENGEKPKSKWTKQAVVDVIAADYGVRSKDVTLKKPYEEYLKKSSWHHTGSKYNKTDFYSVVYSDEDITLSKEAIEKLNSTAYKERIDAISKAKEELSKIEDWTPDVTEDDEWIYVKSYDGQTKKFSKEYGATREKAIEFVTKRWKENKDFLNRIIDINTSYSYEDSDGNKLTEGQQEFFNDSQIRDDQGRLLKMYHGSAQTFTIFGEKGRHDSLFGKYKFGNHNVNFFTSDKDVARGYSQKPDYTYGNVYEGYLNVERPWVFENENDESNSWNTLKNRQLREYQIDRFDRVISDIWKYKDIDKVNDLLRPFKAEVREVDGPGKYELWSLGDNSLFSSDHFIEAGDSLIELFEDEDNLREGILGISEEYGDDDYYFTTNDIVNLVISINERGHRKYDGVIFKDIFDSSGAYNNSTVVVTLDSSNQFKLADNTSPTEDEDINYDFVEEDKKITKEMEAARKLLPSFDENNWNTKRSILEFLRSAEGTKADKDTLSAISSIISVSPDLDVRFIDGAESGSIHRSETGDTLILLDKGLDSAQAIRRTISAEIIHMSENTETYGKFARLVLGSATEEDQNAVKEKYAKYWKDKGIEVTDEALLKECVSELGADMLRDRDLVAQWSKKNKALPVRLAEAAKDLARKLFGKNRDAYKEASRLSSILQSAVVENSIRKATGTPGVQWSLGKRPENQSKTRQEILDEARELHFFTRPKSKQKILDLVKQHMAGYFDSTSGSNLANTFVRDLTLPQPTIEIPADASVKVKGMDRISDMLYQAYYNTGSPRAARKAAEAISKAIMESTYIDGSNILIKDVLNERSRTLATITEKAMADKLYESINGGEAYSHLEDIKNKYDNLMQKIRRESNTREQELRDDIARAKGIMKDTLMALEQIRRATNQIKSPSKFKGILASPQMETLTKVISSAKSRGGFLINENVRGAIQAYVDFFANQDNQRGMSEEAELMGIKKEAARETYEACLEAIKNFPVSGENAMEEVLTDAEIETFTDVARTVAQLYRTYNKYYDAQRKEWIDADAVADQGITNTLKMKKLHEGDKKLVKAFKQLWDRYGIEALDPMAAGRLLDGYNENGVMASMMSDIVEAENAKELRIQKYMKPVDDFISEHKDFEKHLTSEEDKVEFRGQKLTRDEFIQLYMTTFRKQALFHFGFGRMEFGTREGRDGLRIIEPALQVDKDWSSYMKEEGLSIEDFQQDCEKVLVEVRDLGNKVLTKEDREYIKLMENFYNNVSTQDKKKMDMTYFGMTNVIEDETDMYVPIKTSMSSRASSVTDERNAMANFTTLSGQGFNKNTVKGAKNPMVFTGAYSLMKEHANGLSAYVELYAAMQKLDRVWSTDVNHNPQNSSRLRDVLSDTYGDNVEKYVRSLMGDIQGINTKKPNAWNPVIGRMRSNYAIFQLGANPKTWFNQLGSMGALVRFCDIDSIAKGLNAPNKEEMSKYSTAAAIREEGDVAVKAQALTDQVSGRVKDLLMKPIGWSDMKIVGMSWGACQYQIEKTKGYAVGTEENLEAAGLLLNKVINESQDTSLASTKTGIARADSELIKGLAMFRSAPFKQFSRLTDAVGTLATLNARSKSGESISEEQMSAAKKELARTSAGWTMQAAVGIAISAMFAWLYKKDDDKNPLDYIVDFLSEMISVIPIVGDIYSYFADGYDVSYFAYDMLNDAMDNMKDTVSLVANGVSGKKVTRQQIAKAAYNDAVSIGEFTGIPVRNVKNFFAGITKRISSIFGGALGYSMDASMYEQSYQADLKEALESGNERLAEKVVELLYADKKSTSKLSESAATEVLRLYGAGYTAVLPPSIGNKITVDGVDYEVKAKDQKQIRQICDPADDAVIGLIASDIYKGLSDEEKAKAIGKMYTMYYDRALNYVFGVPMSKTDALSYLGDAKTIISAAAHIQNLKADQDETGKTTVSRKSKVNDYIAELGVDEETAELILYASGYSSDALMEAIANIAANAKLTDKQYTAVATALGIAD